MKLFIGICNSQDFVPSGFFWTFVNIKNIWDTIIYRSAHPWDVVRNNKIIHDFLKSDCDILVKMDIDQTYPSNYFEKFVPLVEKYKVIGPLIYDRCEFNNHMPLAFSERYDGMVLRKMDISKKTGIVEIPYAHTNMFYSREVLEKIPSPWYEAYLRDDGLERRNHVDYTFIDKLKDAGYSTYIDLSTVVGHGYYKYIMGNG